MKNMKKILQVLLVIGMVGQSGFAMYDDEVESLLSPEVKRLAENYAKDCGGDAADSGFESVSFAIDLDAVDVNPAAKFYPSPLLRLNEDASKKLYTTLKNIVSKIKDKAAKKVENIKGADLKDKQKKEIIQRASDVLHQVAFGQQEWLLTVRLLQELVKKSAELDRSNLDYALSENPAILKLVGLTGTEEDLCDTFFQIVGANIRQYTMIQSYVHGRRTVQSTSTEEDKIAEFLVNKAFRFCAASQRDAAAAPAWKEGTDDLVNLKAFMSQHKESQGAAQFYASFDITRKCNALRMFTEKIYMVEKKRFTLTGSLFGDGGVGLGLLAAAYVGAYKFGYITSGSSYAKPAELGLQLFTELKTKVGSLFPSASV